eukprot:1160461-Pelagomonas_calceolata.AAC.5
MASTLHRIHVGHVCKRKQMGAGFKEEWHDPFCLRRGIGRGAGVSSVLHQNEGDKGGWGQRRPPPKQRGKRGLGSAASSTKTKGEKGAGVSGVLHQNNWHAVNRNVWSLPPARLAKDCPARLLALGGSGREQVTCPCKLSCGRGTVAMLHGNDVPNVNDGMLD